MPTYRAAVAWSFFLGDQVLADRYNHELGVAGEGRAGEPHILPARLGRVIDRPQFRLDPLGYRHPILEAFRGRGQTSLLTTPVFKHFQLTPSQKSRATTVPGAGQRRSTGDRAIGSPRAGRVGRHLGRAVLDRHAALAEFRPAGRISSLGAQAGQLQRRNVLAGETFNALTSAVGASVSVQSPDGRKRPAAAKARWRPLRPDVRRYAAKRHLYGSVRSAGQP